MRRQAMTDGRPFGEQLRVWRAAAGLTQVALAERCGVDHTYVSKIEHGRNPVPSLALLRAFAATLGVEYDAMCRAAGRVPTEMERARQDEKWGQQNHSPSGWLAVLMEEVGEAAQLVAQGWVEPVAASSRIARRDMAAYLRAELVQVAASPTRWPTPRAASATAWSAVARDADGR